MPSLVTLTATLQNVFGQAAAAGAKLRITLCGFDGAQPEVAGTALLGEVSEEVRWGGVQIRQAILPNDAISPAGTFYCIQSYDAAGNCVAATNYQILSAGGATQDLSQLAPYAPPLFPAVLTTYRLTDQDTGMVWTLYVAFNVLGWMPAAPGLAGVPSITLIDSGTGALTSLSISKSQMSYGPAAPGAAGVASLEFVDVGNQQEVTVTLTDQQITYT